MSFENPQNLIASWNLQTSFATGPVLSDQLVPKKFARIRTPFVCTWREEKLNSILDHASQNFSIYLPESCMRRTFAFLADLAVKSVSVDASLDFRALNSTGITASTGGLSSCVKTYMAMRPIPTIAIFRESCLFIYSFFSWRPSLRPLAHLFGSCGTRA